ncbi:DUF1836 domain-containing protein [Clostridium grantii]|uniref:DUF1836 domain-containing protein n=1 Tax=Clostridium grantii DSM 8605 TaxID=1121316 RepID=A0A1M5V421_9CLOT|nr:DUF1836 domain-containing protein [Clostridium grantii]SHH69946.1 protein of unknown function [Clostridium grantii DSM 8605]
MDKKDKLLAHKAVEIEDIPDIDLYMDQVTSYMDSVLDNVKIDEDDKVLTKTMINNYVKAKIIEKPNKKKYTKNQIMELIMIYHLKNIIPISDIDNLLKYEKSRFITPKNDDKDGKNIEYKNNNAIKEIYKSFLEIQKEVIEESREKFKEYNTENGNANESQRVKEIIKLVLQADMDKRMAELMIKEFKFTKIE